MAGTLAGPGTLAKAFGVAGRGKGSARVPRVGETVPVSRTLEDRRPQTAETCRLAEGISYANKGGSSSPLLDLGLMRQGPVIFASPGGAADPPSCEGILRARMKFPMDRFQALLINVRVNLGRRDVGVAEHLLDDAQISAIAEQMRGKTVS